MAASAVLPDSSFYIRLLREGRDPIKALTLAAQTRDLAVCGTIRCEVGRALRLPRVRQQFHAWWDVMINIPTDNQLFQDAEQTLWTLDRQGIILSVTDVLIACCALRIGATILTFDEDFLRIPGVRATDTLQV
jgi:predicted nucleic acid-binding protein